VPTHLEREDLHRYRDYLILLAASSAIRAGNT